MDRADYAQAHVLGTSGFSSVLAIADDLCAHLELAEVMAAIREANQRPASSVLSDMTWVWRQLPPRVMMHLAEDARLAERAAIGD